MKIRRLADLALCFVVWGVALAAFAMIIVYSGGCAGRSSSTIDPATSQATDRVLQVTPGVSRKYQVSFTIPTEPKVETETKAQ